MEPEVERPADSRLQTPDLRDREDMSPFSSHPAHVVHSLSDVPSTRPRSALPLDNIHNSSSPSVNGIEIPEGRRKELLHFSGARQDCHACRGGQAFIPCNACSCAFSKACASLDTLPLYLLAGALGLWVVLCDGVLREGFSFLCLAQQASCAWRVSGIVSTIAIMLVISCSATTTSDVRLLGTRVATAQDEEGKRMRGVVAGEEMRWNKMHRTTYNGRVTLGVLQEEEEDET